MTTMKPGQLLHDVKNYYTEKIETFGQTARGVDWSSEQSQQLRFQQLARVFDSDRSFSINDLGCGYGALYDYLRPVIADLRYTGVDISSKMIESARSRIGAEQNVKLFVASVPPEPTDYSVASGIFNVRLHHTVSEWSQYVYSTLETLNQSSTKGFSFNCLTSYSDSDRIRPDLFYANPCEIFDFCKSHFSRNVALLHDYNLYEFTILVRKTA